MNPVSIGRPGPDEHAPYYERYVSLVSGDDPVAVLATSLESALATLRSIPENRGEHRYAPGKWSVKQLIGHVTDAERVFGFRALWFSRGGADGLPGFDEDAWAEAGPWSSLPLSSLIEEFEHVRRASISLFRNLDEEAWTRRGAANQQPVSVRALAYIAAGHGLHHLEVLRSRYL